MSVNLSLEKALQLLDSITWDDNADLDPVAAEWGAVSATGEDEDGGGGAADPPLVQHAGFEVYQGTEELEAETNVDHIEIAPSLQNFPVMQHRSLFKSSFEGEDRDLVVGEDAIDLHRVHSMVNDLSYFDAAELSAFSPADLDLWSEDISARRPGADTATSRSGSAGAVGTQTSSCLVTTITSTSGDATMTFSVSSWEQWIANAEENRVS
jgi:hypothetical protein